MKITRKYEPTTIEELAKTRAEVVAKRTEEELIDWLYQAYWAGYNAAKGIQPEDETYEV